MEFPKTFAAAKKAEKGQWAIGDALLEEIGPPRAGKRQDTAFERCARELAESGMPYAPRYLRELRNISAKFDLAGRAAGLTTEVALAAGTPAVLERAEEIAAAENKPVTKRFVAQVRKSVHRATRTAKGLPAMPKPQKEKAIKETAKSELQRVSDVIGLITLAKQASLAGQKLLKELADTELTEEDREDLREVVQQTASTWEFVKDAVDNPVATEIEDFLKASS